MIHRHTDIVVNHIVFMCIDFVITNGIMILFVCLFFLNSMHGLTLEGFQTTYSYKTELFFLNPCHYYNKYCHNACLARFWDKSM